MNANRGVGDIPGTYAVDIRTGSGNITVNGISGGFHAEAGSGDIHGNGSPKNMASRLKKLSNHLKIAKKKITAKV